MDSLSLRPVTAFALLCILHACTPESPAPATVPLKTGTITTFSGTYASQTYSGDGGSASAATFLWVTGVATDGSNNVYITDGAANTVRKISSTDGIVTTVAGKFRGSNIADLTPEAGDGGLATEAHLSVPLGLAVDGLGDIAIADAGNNVVRMVVISADTIGRYAGKGFSTVTYSGDGGPSYAALLWNPYGVAADLLGNIYIADAENNAIRKINRSTGIITTIAGSGPNHPGYSGDGADATLATLNMPTAVCVDHLGNVYISDTGNNVVRLVSNGIITTFAGSGTIGYSGDGGLANSAKLSYNSGVAVDADGNLYIADSGNSVIRMVTAATGIISTVAGTGTAGYSGDGGPAMSAKLSNPTGVAVDGKGILYIADSYNSVIRAVKLK